MGKSDLCNLGDNQPNIAVHKTTVRRWISGSNPLSTGNYLVCGTSAVVTARNPTESVAVAAPVAGSRSAALAAPTPGINGRRWESTWKPTLSLGTRLQTSSPEKGASVKSRQWCDSFILRQVFRQWKRCRETPTGTSGDPEQSQTHEEWGCGRQGEWKPRESACWTPKMTNNHKPLATFANSQKQITAFGTHFSFTKRSKPVQVNVHSVIAPSINHAYPSVTFSPSRCPPAKGQCVGPQHRPFSSFSNSIVRVHQEHSGEPGAWKRIPSRSKEGRSADKQPNDTPIEHHSRANESGLRCTNSFSALDEKSTGIGRILQLKGGASSGDEKEPVTKRPKHTFISTTSRTIALLEAGARQAPTPSFQPFATANRANAQQVPQPVFPCAPPPPSVFNFFRPPPQPPNGDLSAVNATLRRKYSCFAFNINNENQESAEAIFDQLLITAAVPKCNVIIAIQECDQWSPDRRILGWKIIKQYPGKAALCISEDVVPHIRKSIVCSAVVSLMLADGCVFHSAYLPNVGHCRNGDHLFNLEANNLSEQMRQMKQINSESKQIVMGDLNTDFQTAPPYFGPSALGKHGRTNDYLERRNRLCAICHEFRLRSVLTFEPAEDNLWTRSPWSDGGTPTQIDHILVDTRIATSVQVHNQQRFRVSDHFPISCVVFMEQPQGRGKRSANKHSKKPKDRKTKSLKGWKPQGPPQTSQYAQELSLKVTGYHGIPFPTALGSPSINITGFQAAMTGAACSVKHTTWADRILEVQKVPQDLRELEEHAQEPGIGVDETRRRRKKARCRRKGWTAIRDATMMRMKASKSSEVNALVCGGKPSEDREMWHEEISAFMDQKFNDPTETCEVQTQRVAVFRHRQHEEESRGTASPVMTMDIVVQARSKLLSGKAPGGDGVVAEMINAIPICTVYIIAHLFAERFSGQKVENVKEWHTVVLFFIKKIQGTTVTMNQLRMISIAPVLAKWYMTAVMIIYDRYPYPPQWRLLAVGGLKGLGADYITTSLKLLIERTHEWRSDDEQGFFLVNADVERAFDSLHPRESADTLSRSNVPPVVAAAILQEGIQVNGELAFEGVHVSTPINACVKQGTVEASRLFGATLLSLLAPAREAWAETKQGVIIGSTFVSIIVFADNVWLFSPCWGGVQQMLQTVSDIIGYAGFRLKPESLEYMPIGRAGSSPDLGTPIFVYPPKETKQHYESLKQNPPLPVKLVSTMLILGVMLSANGSDKANLDRRVQKATKMFWSLADFLLCPTIPIARRLGMYSDKVTSVLVHAMGSVSFCKSIAHKISAVELCLLRRMYRCPKQSEEPMETYMRRSARFVRKDFVERGFVPAVEVVLHSIIREAAKLRPKSQEPLALTLSQIIPWRDTVWWKTVQAVSQDSMDSPPLEVWRHHSEFNGRTAKWDCVLFKVLGESWRDHPLLLNPKCKRLLSDFVRNALTCIGLERPVATGRHVLARGLDERPRKNARVLPPRDEAVTIACASRVALVVFGDNATVIDWANGVSSCDSSHYLVQVAFVQRALYELWHVFGCTPRSPCATWAFHVNREHNPEADLAADIASKSRRPYHSFRTRIPKQIMALRVFFDGTIGKEDSCDTLIPAAGVWLQVSTNAITWTTIATYSFPCHPMTTTMGAELDGLTHAVAIMRTFIELKTLPRSDDPAYLRTTPTSMNRCL